MTRPYCLSATQVLRSASWKASSDSTPADTADAAARSIIAGLISRHVILRFVPPAALPTQRFRNPRRPQRLVDPAARHTVVPEVCEKCRPARRSRGLAAWE